MWPRAGVGLCGRCRPPSVGRYRLDRDRHCRRGLVAAVVDQRVGETVCAAVVRSGATGTRPASMVAAPCCGTDRLSTKIGLPGRVSVSMSRMTGVSSTVGANLLVALVDGATTYAKRVGPAQWQSRKKVGGAVRDRLVPAKSRRRRRHPR